MTSKDRPGADDFRSGESQPEGRADGRTDCPICTGVLAEHLAGMSIQARHRSHVLAAPVVGEREEAEDEALALVIARCYEMSDPSDEALVRAIRTAGWAPVVGDDFANAKSEREEKP